MTDTQTIVAQAYKLIDGLNKVEDQTDHSKYMDSIGRHRDHWLLKKVGQKFGYIDCGGSGAFLFDKNTGELYNIKGYGVPDYNKKKKADIGNVFTVDPVVLHSKRWNYLR